MYCPKCGQQQISDGARFCSRCGLPLDGIAEIVATNGLLAPAVTPPQKPQPWLRRKGIRTGAKLVFLSVILFPVFLAMAIIFDEPVPLFVPFTIFLIGLAKIIYTQLFGESDLPAMSAPPPQPFAFNPTQARAELPTQQSVPASFNASRANSTAEITQPPSVTEHTTVLLDKN